MARRARNIPHRRNIDTEFWKSVWMTLIAYSRDKVNDNSSVFEQLRSIVDVKQAIMASLGS